MTDTKIKTKITLGYTIEIHTEILLTEHEIEMIDKIGAKWDNIYITFMDRDIENKKFAIKDFDKRIEHGGDWLNLKNPHTIKLLVDDEELDKWTDELSV